MTSEGNSALLPANVDRRPPLQRGLMNFQLYNLKSLEDWSLGKQLILFLPDLLKCLILAGTVLDFRILIQEDPEQQDRWTFLSRAFNDSGDMNLLN